ncbi:uncharacterized protein Dwil_GK25378 [Drosophila willistoni]|uniref:MD-2-related lipid-recognition domain-containing protein n=1 Tax=Drosophila willistoni TaxID=7260 RepID=B4NE01_DROWI|nr:uncharacterized protein LOC6648600 [Drosophila willistoni]EDW81970.1 uncharacterized protein Dwil_GK25378 [Drosophila willistoni]
MWTNNFKLLLSLLFLLPFVKALGNEKTWTYTLVDITVTSSDESKVKAEARIERMGRGEFGLSGQIVLGVLVPPSIDVEVLTYRSADSGQTYKLQPYGVQRQGIYNALNNFYKNIIMESAKDCSNLPQFEGNLTEIGPDTYNFEKCQVKTDSFPQYMPEGFLKIVMLSYGEVEVKCEIIVNIEKKTF